MKPILFNTEMVRAILEGRKTVTRRIANISTEITCSTDGTTNHDFTLDNSSGGTPTGFVCRKCGFGAAHPYSRVPVGTSIFRPRYWPGDILYVRETWSFWPCYDCDNEMCNGRGISYKDEDGCFVYKTQRSKVPYDEKWKPSIHMPKEAARIFLRVKNVRVERLRSITADDAMNEGFTDWNKFVELWDSTIPKHPNKFKSYPYYWKDNPWVWVIEFERISKEEALTE